MGSKRKKSNIKTLKKKQRDGPKAKQKRKQHQCQSESSKHDKHYFEAIIQRSMQLQRISSSNLQLDIEGFTFNPCNITILFLLLATCLRLQTSCAMEYSAKLSNCYDLPQNFSDTAPKQFLNTSSTIRLSWPVKSANHNNYSYEMNSSVAASLPQAVFSDITWEGSTSTLKPVPVVAPTQLSGWKCCCWNATNEEEVECRCEGDALLRVPQTLTVPMQRLTIASAGLPRLRNTGLKKYANSLLDIVLTDMKHLECIEDGAFASTHLLRTIYISHAPKLTFLSKDVFYGISSSIKIIRIINSGLTQVPDLIHLPSTNILQMIDLDNNRITRIEKETINLKTDQLILANNDIRYIDDSAFYGSQIAKLILKGNRYLSDVHPNAFYGMSMQELDLSSTSLVRLPSVGLQDIEELRIQDTHTLKTIPSIYNFKNLQRAYLTHSFHCCAFKFPQRHDPRRHAERMKEIEKWQQQCNNNKNTNSNKNNIESKSKSRKSRNAIVRRYSENAISQGNREQATGHRTRKLMVSEELMVTGNDNDNNVAVRQQTVSMNNANENFNAIDGRQPKNQGSQQEEIATMRQDGRQAINSENGRIYSSSRLAPQTFDIEKRLQNATSRANVAFDAPNAANSLSSGGFTLTNAGILIDDSTNLNGIIDEYSSDSMLNEIGIFHDQITIDPDENQSDEYCGNFTFRKHDVECYPAPNALNPCEDVMGYQWLRIAVWIVVALAVIGNVAVLVVILSIKSETASVPRFLMCHLAFADLCLGLYLLLIASIDAHSMGEYFNYAYDWQYGAGCQVAGFLTVFASHLSVFTLTVITLERWLAITHALYLNKRIKLRSAAFIMTGGWIYSTVMSLLPLFGISNYSSTSICLPMEIRDSYDVMYLVVVLGLNGLPFFIIAICYAQIYLSLGKETRHANNANPREMSIAKKMALLVFTNFACWAPIAFFGLTALFDYPLINVTKSKILLVFFYPLNSCADPYLYAILTTQYRQDLFTLLAKFGLCKENVLKYKNSVSYPGSTHFTIHGGSLRKTSLKASQNKLAEAQSMLKRKEEFV